MMSWYGSGFRRLPTHERRACGLGMSAACGRMSSGPVATCGPAAGSDERRAPYSVLTEYMVKIRLRFPQQGAVRAGCGLARPFRTVGAPSQHAPQRRRADGARCQPMVKIPGCARRLGRTDPPTDSGPLIVKVASRWSVCGGPWATGRAPQRRPRTPADPGNFDRACGGTRQKEKVGPACIAAESSGIVVAGRGWARPGARRAPYRVLGARRRDRRRSSGRQTVKK